MRHVINAIIILALINAIWLLKIQAVSITTEPNLSISNDQADLLLDHLSNNHISLNTDARYSYIRETLNFLYFMVGEDNVNVEYLTEYLRQDRGILIPIDDILFINIEDLESIEDDYELIYVFNNAMIHEYYTIYNASSRTLTLYETEIITNLYEECNLDNSIIEAIYLLRCLINMNYYFQSNCDKINDGLLNSPWFTTDPEYYEYSNNWRDIIDSIGLMCDEQYICWRIEVDDEVVNFRIRNTWAGGEIRLSLLGFGLLKTDETTFMEEYEKALYMP